MDNEVLKFDIEQFLRRKKTYEGIQKITLEPIVKVWKTGLTYALLGPAKWKRSTCLRCLRRGDGRRWWCCSLCPSTSALLLGTARGRTRLRTCSSSHRHKVFIHLLNYLTVHLSIYLLTQPLTTCLSTGLSTYLITYLPIYLLTYLLTNLNNWHTYPSTCPPVYLPTYLHT